jgi:hypothetical protein
MPTVLTSEHGMPPKAGQTVEFSVSARNAVFRVLAQHHVFLLEGLALRRIRRESSLGGAFLKVSFFQQLECNAM